jgi:coenzyme F420-reducing hydrogenase delta subunit
MDLMKEPETPKITVMYCINSFEEKTAFHAEPAENVRLNFIKLACSSMVKDVYLLRAFEAGSDAVMVFVCPKGHCRYVEGNIRAAKRIAWVQKLLDEIGVGGERLSLHAMAAGDTTAPRNALKETLKTLEAIGLSPAR